MNKPQRPETSSSFAEFLRGLKNLVALAGAVVAVLLPLLLPECRQRAKPYSRDVRAEMMRVVAKPRPRLPPLL